MSEKTDVFKKFVSKYKEGEVLYKQGEEQKDFFIINKGKVQLKLDNDAILLSLGKGDFFGEESLNEGQEAAYTVEVVENSDIIKIPFPALTEMMKQNTGISLKILKKLSEKSLKLLENVISLGARVKPVVIKDSTPMEIQEDEKTSEKIDADVKAYLIIKRSNRIVQLTKTHTFLGRRDYTTGFVPDVDLTKEDEEKYISRKHSKISFINDKFYVSEEPGAVNGTFLNGNKLATGVKHELKNEDEVTLCHLDIVFKV
jgi:CRP-like cAMP-binding protein